MNQHQNHTQKPEDNLYSREKKQKIILAVVGVVLIIAFGVVMSQVLKENSKCTVNPFSYAYNKLVISGGNYSCYCKSNVPNLNDIGFNETDVFMLPTNSYFQKGLK